MILFDNSHIFETYQICTNFSFLSMFFLAQPEISIYPRNVTIARGDNVTFRCSVVGNPTPSVVWTKDKDLDVTANSRVTLSSRNDHHSLEIARVYLSDSGQYRCVANNSQGRSSSSAATLTVQCKQFALDVFRYYLM